MGNKGTLWQAVVRRTQEALARGDLQPIPTEPEFVEDGGIRFVVRVVANLARKRRFPSDICGQHGPRHNPFLPYEQAMFVADISPTHVCLLNKYNVVEHHVLLVTREYEDQESALNRVDFEALWTCMAEYEGLGFYNSGVVAGASQPHKHLQFVPLPLAREGPAVPIEPLLANLRWDGELGRIACWPFRHAVARVSWSPSRAPGRLAAESEAAYREMLRAVGAVSGSPRTARPPAPYNLLVTRSWMLVVPRACECFASVSLNALAFAGALLVRDEFQLQAIKAYGPLRVLQHVGFPHLDA